MQGQIDQRFCWTDRQTGMMTYRSSYPELKNIYNQMSNFNVHFSFHQHLQIFKSFNQFKISFNKYFKSLWTFYFMP